jgi:hypothetical protein
VRNDLPNPDPERSDELPVWPEIEHHVFASSFADPDDVRRFRRCKDQGKSDEECFKVGDNGIGFFGDDCTGPTPMCALPPEDLEERWGSIAAARHRQVEVSCNGRIKILILADLMPHRANITNGAGIDLSPAAVDALGLRPPVMIRAAWRWLAV